MFSDFGLRRVFDRFINFTTTTNNLIIISPDGFRAKLDNPVVFNMEVSNAAIFLGPRWTIDKNWQSLEKPKGLVLTFAQASS